MYAIFETSHNPAIVPAHKLGEVADRPAAVLFLEARGWAVICCEFDEENDAADLAAARGKATLATFTVEKI